MAAMQSQQAWIISQHLASPLVQVIVQPFSVISHLHIPIIRLQQQTVRPFIIMQQLHMPPASMEQRCCIMEQPIGSSQTQVIFMPPLTFSILTVQRGAIIIMPPAGIADPRPMPAPMPAMPGMPIRLDRSIIIAPVISDLL
jgi:hypothetical protein